MTLPTFDDGEILYATELNQIVDELIAVDEVATNAIPKFSDPNADRLVFWDDSTGTFSPLIPSTGLQITGTSMTVRGATSAQTGMVELATDTEAALGVDTSRAVTPANMKPLLDARYTKTEVDNLLANERPFRVVYDIPAGTWTAGGVRIFTIPYGKTLSSIPGLSLELMGGPGGSNYLTVRLGTGSSVTNTACDVQVWNTTGTSQTMSASLPLVVTVIPVA